jgi:erythromycin esterase-like protein
VPFCRNLLAIFGVLLTVAGCAASEGAAQSEDTARAAQSPAASSDWARLAVPLTGAPSDHDPLVQAARDARFVLLGESSHGTHEYYRDRALISERLVRELGFGAVAIEGDWSGTYRVNLYVRGRGGDRTAEQALSGYRNFPRWMWRNAEFRDFIDRLHNWNLTQPPERRVGVYGMDVYDLFDAQDAVIAYLRRVDPAATGRAQRHYRCFAPYNRSSHAYGEAARRQSSSCEDEAAAVVAEVRRLPRPEAPAEAESHFTAVRAAASVAGGEAYFRSVYAGSMSWNVRDQQMARNLDEIADHVGRVSGRPGKVVAWAHNSHMGDARATFAARQGELNIGQLMRQRHGEAAFLVGFFTHGGTVMAAPEWDMPGRVYQVRPALPGSYSDLFHRSGMPAFSLVLRGNKELARQFGQPRLQRAIGVIYRPETERQSHYFDARLSEQFDAILFFNRSRGVTPLR